MTTTNELDAAQVVSKLRGTLRNGRTRPAKWRLEQLRRILKLLEENEEEISAALHSDLRKSKHESYICEVGWFCLLFLFFSTLSIWISNP